MTDVHSSQTTSIQTEIRVRYAETDAMAVAHHANYPVWFEVGRTDLMHALGLPYAEVEARGYYLMLSGLNVQYRRAARYDDRLTLTTHVSEVRSRTLKFTYQLHRAVLGGSADLPAELIATGETQHIATDKAYRPARLPDEVLKLLQGG
ncbi:acyl-CoA thioesterase [Deinococcus aquatilis]|jgi:acyl-CoA thioester hydrolase|uniref:acyl-CoA thioesterase n=1 Tax=Deinococcus aquatilis TaxID=519440 RepID=UPI000360C6E9|nr:thioesterase family protein [Deinococcus aquatilis]